MTSYLAAPALGAFLAGLAALAVLVTSVGLFGLEVEGVARRLRIEIPSGSVQATLHAALAAGLVLYIPAAALLALEPFQSGSLGWIVVGVWLAALTALLCSARAPMIGTDAPPEPRLVAAAGLFVTGVGMIVVSRLDGESVFRAGIGLAILVGVWLAWFKRAELWTAALVALVLMLLVGMAGPDAAERVAIALARLAIGAFAGCVLAAAGIALAAFTRGRGNGDALPGWWGFAVPLALVIGAAAAPAAAVAVSIAVGLSMLGLAAVIGRISLVEVRSALAR